MSELLEHRPDTRWPNRGDLALLRPGEPRYFWEQEGMLPGMDGDLEQMRNDQPLSRKRW